MFSPSLSTKKWKRNLFDNFLVTTRLRKNCRGNNDNNNDNNKQQTTNNKQQTTNKKQETRNNKQQPTTNNQQPTTNNQQPTTEQAGDTLGNNSNPSGIPGVQSPQKKKKKTY